MPIDLTGRYVLPSDAPGWPNNLPDGWRTTAADYIKTRQKKVSESYGSVHGFNDPYGRAAMDWLDVYDFEHPVEKLHEDAPNPPTSPSTILEESEGPPDPNQTAELMGPPHPGNDLTEWTVGSGVMLPGFSRDHDGLGTESIDLGKNVTNKLVFDAFSESGQLNNLNGDEGTLVHYPESLGSDPEITQAIHFDFYYKKAPSIEDIIEKVETVVDGAVNAFGSVVDVGGSALDIISGGINTASETEVPIGSVIKETTSQLFNFFNEEMEGAKKDVNQSEITKDTRLSRAEERSLDKLSLYLPAGLAINHSAGYEGHDMSTIRNMLSGEGSLIPGLAKAAASFVDDAASSIAGIELNTGAAINALTGTIKNPRKEMMFSGVEIRSFDFTFQFRPKSKNEALAMLQAIKLLRFHSLPEINPSISFLSVPSEVQVSFLDYVNTAKAPDPSGSGYQGEYMVESPWLPKLGRCAITGVNVTFHPESNTVFGDGIPTMADVSLTLTELEAISRNHVSELGM